MTEAAEGAQQQNTTADRGTLDIYLQLVRTVDEQQARLAWSELAFTVLEVAIFFACGSQLVRFGNNPAETVGTLRSAVVLSGLAIGMAVSAYWITRAMRLQLRLKLRYFQGRYLERKLAGLGEDILGAEARFNKDLTSLESPDGVETIVYPQEGPLRLDGFFGSARPRVLSVVMPGLFFAIYSALFAWVLVAILAAA